MCGMVYEPCVFDLQVDPREEHPIENQSLIDTLWLEFNKSLVTQYTTLLPGKEDGLTPLELPGLEARECNQPADLQSEQLQHRFFGTDDSPYCHLDRCHVEQGDLICAPLAGILHAFSSRTNLDVLLRQQEQRV